MDLLCTSWEARSCPPSELYFQGCFIINDLRTSDSYLHSQEKPDMFTQYCNENKILRKTFTVPYEIQKFFKYIISLQQEPACDLCEGSFVCLASPCGKGNLVQPRLWLWVVHYYVWFRSLTFLKLSHNTGAKIICLFSNRQIS